MYGVGHGSYLSQPNGEAVGTDLFNFYIDLVAWPIVAPFDFDALTWNGLSSLQLTKLGYASGYRTFAQVPTASRIEINQFTGIASGTNVRSLEVSWAYLETVYGVLLQVQPFAYGAAVNSASASYMLKVYCNWFEGYKPRLVMI